LEAETHPFGAKLDEENMQMKRNRIIQWVLTGGGIMLVGFFIGLFSSSRSKSQFFPLLMDIQKLTFSLSAAASPD
jgi:hypothetical protein